MTPSVAPNRPRWRHARADAGVPARAGDPDPRRRAAAADRRGAGRARVDHARSPTSAARCRPPTCARRAWSPPRTAAKRSWRRYPRRSTSASWRFSSKPRVLASPDARPRRHRPGARPAHRARRHRHRRGDHRGDQRPQARAGRQRQAPAVGHRPALRRRRDRRGRSGRRRAGRAQAAASPIYTVALGTAQGTITVPRRRPARHETAPVPPDPSRSPRWRRPPAARRSRAADANKLSDVYKSLGSPWAQEREAPDHGGLRRRRPRPAPPRRRHVPALVRPPDLKKKATPRNP